MYEKIFIYCNSDEAGNIKDLIAGPAVIPDKQYQHFFIVEDWKVIDNQQNYKIVDDGLGYEKKIVEKSNAE